MTSKIIYLKLRRILPLTADAARVIYYLRPTIEWLWNVVSRSILN